MKTISHKVFFMGIFIFQAIASTLSSAAAAEPARAEALAIRVDSLLYLYEDPAGAAGPADILALYRGGRLAPLGASSLRRGYTESFFWLVLPLPPGTEGKRLHLFTTSLGLFRLELFVPRADGSFDRTAGSYVEPYRERTGPLVNPSVSFVAPAAGEGGERDVLLKISSDSALNTSFMLSDALGLYEYGYARAILLSSIFAVLVALLAYNALVAIFAKERDYLFYVFYLAFYILYLADLQLIDFQFIFPGAPGSWVKLASPVLGSCTLFLSAIFAKVFLGIDRRNRVLDAALYALMLLSLSLAFVAVAGPRYGIVSRYGNDLAAAVVVAEIAVIVARVVQGFRPALFFLLANLSVAAGVLVYSLWVNGFVKESFWVSSASLLGQTLQLILFSVSLALKLNLEKRGRIAAQERLAQQEIASRKFVPFEFLEFLGKKEISEVGLGQNIEEKMTVMFADIRSFTSLSESMSPRGTFDFINSYLQRIVPAVKDYGGFIDKFIGDSILALFPQEAGTALGAAVEIQQAITDYNGERSAKGQAPIRTGIGMHTGRLMLGIIGDAERMESTVLSDAVNLASRVEKLNKFFGTSILITEETFKDLEDPLGFQYRFLGIVKVKGKTKPSTIFEIFGGETEERRRRKVATQRDFEQALVAYLMRDFTRARSLFAEIIRANGEDRAAAYYYLRAKNAMENPPPPDWDGTIQVGGV